MELAKQVAVATMFLVAVFLLASGRAFGADSDLLKKNARARAALADEAEELRRVDQREARVVKEPARAVSKRNFERLCIIKPVMADKEIEACRISYQRRDI
jgi:hypothetical protein